MVSFTAGVFAKTVRMVLMIDRDDAIRRSPTLLPVFAFGSAPVVG